MNTNKSFQEKAEDTPNASTTREVNKNQQNKKEDEYFDKDTSKSNEKVNKGAPQDIENEELTHTCFSSEAEEKFKIKTRKFNSFIRRTFEPPQVQGNSRWADLKARTIWTIIMLLMFMLFIGAGHVYCSILVFLIMTCIFMELIDLNKYRDRNLEIKWFYPLAWYFLVLGMYYFNVKTLRHHLLFLEKYKFFQVAFQHHNFICFLLYCLGFAAFLKSLTKGYLRYQFSSFTFNHLITIMLSMTTAMLVYNIFSGLFWFVLPSGMVICNDISAYIWGRMFGRTKLTDLSPKKTVEGFVGAFFTTIIYSFVMSSYILKYDLLQSFLCPASEITFVPFKFDNCDMSKFTDTSFTIYGYVIMNLHVHTFAVAMFTSILAPMGGFFASGFKRAIKIKDFSNTIPGHGGFTDRMDCQVLVGIFTSLWLSNFVYTDNIKLGIIIRLLEQLSDGGKVRVLQYLNDLLGISNA